MAVRQMRRPNEHPCKAAVVNKEGRPLGPFGKQLPGGPNKRIPWMGLVARELGINVAEVESRLTERMLVRPKKRRFSYVTYRPVMIPRLRKEQDLEKEATMHESGSLSQICHDLWREEEDRFWDTRWDRKDYVHDLDPSSPGMGEELRL